MDTKVKHDVTTNGDGANTVRVRVRPPDIRIAVFELVGTAPYVQNRFANKAKMIEAQEKGKQAGKKAVRTPKDFTKLYEEARHVSREGWAGIPAPAFRSALISACRLVGFHMTMAKLTVFIVPDGFDKNDGTPLVRIRGDYHRHDSPVRNDDESVDIRTRPMWDKWNMTLRVQYDAGQFSQEDIANLLLRAGMQVGVGEGRHDSKTSHGCGWGTFIITDKAQSRAS